MSVNGLQQQYIPPTLDGLNVIEADQIYIDGSEIKLDDLVPYTGADKMVDLGAQKIRSTWYAANPADLINKNVLDTTISNLTIAISGTFLDKLVATPQTVNGLVTFESGVAVKDKVSFYDGSSLSWYNQLDTATNSLEWYSTNPGTKIVFNNNGLIYSTAWSASRVMITDVNGNLSSSSVTSTTLGYLDISSSLTGLLNGKLSLTGGTMTGDILMGVNKVKCTSSPLVDDDLTRKGYVDTNLAFKANLAGNQIFTGTNTFSSALPIALTGLTASRVLQLSNTGVVQSSSVTTTTLGFLDATSSIQTQLNTLTNTFANYLPLAGGTISGNLTVQGLVGIGTTNPSATSLIEVFTTTTAKDVYSARMNNATGGSTMNQRFYFKEQSPGLVDRYAYHQARLNANLSTDQRFFCSDINGNDNRILTIAGHTQRVGIRTDTPQGTLGVYGASGEDFITLHNGTYSNGQWINQRFLFGDVAGTNRSAYIQAALPGSNQTDLLFYTDSGTGAVSERFRVKGNGAHQMFGGLQVYANGAGGPAYVYTENAAAGDAYAVMFLKNNIGAAAYWFLNSSTRSADGGANCATLRNDAGDLRLQAAGAVRGLHIKGTSGDVGIGTTVPNKALDVYVSNAYSSRAANPLPANFSVSSTTSRLYMGAYYTGGVGACATIQSSDYYSSLDHGTNLLLNPIGGFVSVGASTNSVAVDPIAKFTINASYGAGNSGAFCINASDGAIYNLRLYPFVQGGGQVAYSFQVNNMGSSKDAMTIGYNGYVGIGTAIPSAPVTVNGSITIRNGTNIYEPGCIYTDANWGMLFRAAVVPGIAHFKWDRSDGNEMMRFTTNGVLDIKGTDGGTWGRQFMIKNGSLIIGRTDTDYGANWAGGVIGTANLGCLMMECDNTTEAVIHDSGNRITSWMHYNGNLLTIGRDVGWGVTPVAFQGETYLNGTPVVGTTRSIQFRLGLDEINPYRALWTPLMFIKLYETPTIPPAYGNWNGLSVFNVMSLPVSCHILVQGFMAYFTDSPGRRFAFARLYHPLTNTYYYPEATKYFNAVYNYECVPINQFLYNMPAGSYDLYMFVGGNVGVDANARAFLSVTAFT